MASKRLDQYKGVLSPKELANGMSIAMRNAERLCDDASLLLENRRFASAAALAVLAIEEAGKLSILRRLATATTDAMIASCWREYRSHTHKNRIGGVGDLFAKGGRKLDDFAALFVDDAEYPHLMDQLKQVALYSDCLGSARWSEPSTVVGEELAKQIVQTARIVTQFRPITETEIELWIKHIGPVSGQHPEWAKHALENWYEDMQKHGLMPEGDNTMRRFIREGLRAAPQEPDE